VRYKLPEDGADPRHGRHPDIQILVLQQLQHLHTVNGTGDKYGIMQKALLLLPVPTIQLFRIQSLMMRIHTLGSISNNIFSRKVIILKVDVNGFNHQ
jgi:hypothetical protein